MKPRPAIQQCRPLLAKSLVIMSLVLALAAAALWIDSLWHERMFIFSREAYRGNSYIEKRLTLESASGGLHLYWVSATAALSDLPWEDRQNHWDFIHESRMTEGYPDFSDEILSGTRLAGFGLGFVRGFMHMPWRGGWQCELIFPHAALVIPLSAPACILFIKRVRRRKQDGRFRCLRCSYDLRAHHPGEKCPECGTIISSPSPR
jgi:hypothetical protein